MRRLLPLLLGIVVLIGVARPAAASTLSVVVDTEAFRKVEADVRVWEAAALREKIANRERQMYLTD